MTLPAAAPKPGRDIAVDALRGFALFGVILVNVPFFASPIYEGPALKTALDRWAFGALLALGVGKFFLIFSFLFGFATSITADLKHGRASGPRFMRRLLGLLAFGMQHAVFLFIGDILMLYAALGLILWLARDLRPATLLTLSTLAYLVAIAAQAAALTAAGFDEEGVLARARHGGAALSCSASSSAPPLNATPRRQRRHESYPDPGRGGPRRGRLEHDPRLAA